jgi:hypothetical protein
MELNIFQRIAEEVKSLDLSILSFDFECPWGGFL